MLGGAIASVPMHLIVTTVPLRTVSPGKKNNLPLTFCVRGTKS